jgi:outer membrane protein assembly factor BamB/tetratricopeptide (TPR) repeat protein
MFSREQSLATRALGKRSARVAVWFVLVCLTNPLRAQPEPARPVGTLFGEEKRALDELATADRAAGEKKWGEAVRRYQQILAESGDLLVPVGGGRSLPARWVVHQKLATTDPAGRKLFRDNVNDSARKLLEQGAAARDPVILERIVADTFCATPAEQALHLLGDLAMERGDFEAAERWWRMLARPASREAGKDDADKPTFELVYPDPADGGAAARAKQILALLFQGATDHAKEELKAFRQKHAAAEGQLAGRKGMYADVLQQLSDTDAHRALAPTAAGPVAWPTFAGGATRNSVLPAEATPYWPDTPHWRVTLPGDPTGKPHRDSDPPPGTGSASRSLAFEPVIAAGHILIADTARVLAFQETTGKLVSEYRHGDKNKLPETIDLRVPSRTDARYTLTVDGNRVYARLGAQPMKAAENNKPHEIDTAIVCLGLDRGATGDVTLRYRWQIRGRMLDTEPSALFEGAPLVAHGRLFVAKTRFEGRQSVTAVECYDADAPEGRDEPPPLRWKQDLWGIDVAGPSEPTRHRHDLLTLAGPFVVYCTHSGAIVALDAASGKRAWAYRYPTTAAKPLDGTLPRDLCPCVFAQGRVYAAPSDSDRILCLDALTGEKVWESSPAHVVQLLGVARGRLFVTLGGYPQGIRCYHVGKGTPLWTKPDEGDRATFGRGFLADRWVFWPTRFGLKVLRQDDGEPEDSGSGPEPWGNLALGDGCLIVATPTEVWGFVPDRLRLGHWQKEVEENPDDALARYHLALAEADSGMADAAIADFRKAADSPDADQYHQGQPLRDLAQQRWHELLLTKASRVASAPGVLPDAAITALREAAGEPFELADRVRALLPLNRAGVKGVPDILGKDELRSVWVTRSDGVPLRADDFLASHLGASGLAELEKRVSDKLASDFDATARAFPWPRAVRAGLQERAAKHEAANEPWPAADRYRQLLSAARWDPDVKSAAADRRTAREGLIRIYEKTGYTDAARSLRWRIEQDHPPRDPSNRPPFPPPAAFIPDVSEKLDVAWTEPLDRFREHPLRPLRHAATGEEPPAADPEGRCFFARAREIVGRSIRTGKPLWTTAVAHDADFSATHAETVIVAGPLGVSRLRRSDGALLWQFLAADPRPMPTRLGPPFRSLAFPPEPEPFSAFRLAGSRLFFRRGSGRLFALDVETGRVLWVCRPPGAPLLGPEDGAAFSEHFLATDDRLLAQTAAGKLLAIDAADGRILFQKDAPATWTSPPVQVDADTAVCSTDGEHLVALNIMTGTERWNRPFDGWPSLAGTAAQVRLDGSQLLVRVERNYGFEVERRSAKTGEPELPPMFIGRDGADLFAVGLAESAYVVPLRDTVRAYSRESGRVAWTRGLPKPGTWRVHAAHPGLLVFPDDALPETDQARMADLAARELGTIPTLGRMHTAAAMLYHAWVRRVAPLLAVDAADGRVIQTRNFAAAGPRAALLLGGRDAAVVVEGKIQGLK